MDSTTHFDELVSTGKIVWSEDDRGWIGAPRDVIEALSQQGYAGFKHETTTAGRDRVPLGGLWQGLDLGTGEVASIVWRRRTDTPFAVLVVELAGVRLEHVPTAVGRVA